MCEIRDMFWQENRTMREWDRTVTNMKVLTGQNMPLSRTWKRYDISWTSFQSSKIPLEGKKKRKETSAKTVVVWQGRTSILEGIILM